MIRINEKQIEILKDMSEFNSELTQYEFNEIVEIYKRVYHRIVNRSDKYKCPHCGEFLIKSDEFTYPSGTKKYEYKCAHHYYTLEIRE